jgi:hypothetical protein
MVKNEARLTIPNPHDGDIDWSLMKGILRNADSPFDRWDKA